MDSLRYINGTQFIFYIIIMNGWILYASHHNSSMSYFQKGVELTWVTKQHLSENQLLAGILVSVPANTYGKSLHRLYKYSLYINAM